VKLTVKPLSSCVKFVNFTHKFTIPRFMSEIDLQASRSFPDVYSHLFNFAYYHR